MESYPQCDSVLLWPRFSPATEVTAKSLHKELLSAGTTINFLIVGHFLGDVPASQNHDSL